MAANRLNRDQILIRALDLADSAVLDNKDRPSGTIVSTALSIGWLQEALDLFHKKFPFQSVINTATLTFPKDGTVATGTPTDMILPYRNGIVLAADEGRLIMRGLDRILNLNQTVTGKPKLFTVRANQILYWPKSEKQRTGTLHYYQLPAVLGATDTPSFPDDMILVEYVWIKAQEWHRVQPPGTALQFAQNQIKELQIAGVGQEAEEDQIPLDPDYAREQISDPQAWMGPVIR